MIVYFYEWNLDGFYCYVNFVLVCVSINYSFYVSWGYVIFVLDILYWVGYFG